jgi:hypothetical protein
MSDAGDVVDAPAPAEVEVTTDAPKGKLSVEDALQVSAIVYCLLTESLNVVRHLASPEERTCSRWSCSWSS